MIEKLSRKSQTELRDAFAVNVVDALKEQYPLTFFPNRTVELTATTSDCPVVRVDLCHGEVYHVTITRARK